MAYSKIPPEWWRNKVRSPATARPSGIPIFRVPPDPRLLGAKDGEDRRKHQARILRHGSAVPAVSGGDGTVAPDGKLARDSREHVVVGAGVAGAVEVRKGVEGGPAVEEIRRNADRAAGACRRTTQPSTSIARLSA
jgi:hypothetical protein